MAIFVIGTRMMCCEECGGYAFLARIVDGKIVGHHTSADEVDEELQPWLKKMFARCPNAGKNFAFPAAEPIYATEVTS